MDSKRLEQAEQIFHEVADLPPGERTRVARLRCGDDASLLGVVTGLLAHDAPGGGTEGFLSRITSDEPLFRMAPMPRRIGAYEIVRVIGEGGMGTVYEARQENPRRSVALKIIRGGSAFGASREMVARLRREAQVLGSMHHPGIAAIFEAGAGRAEGEGVVLAEQPYIAMELVRGPGLLEHARVHALGVRQKLELIARVCDAVHHAHSRGVIHRDLKPGNILVDEHGQPKVLDFGVARATGSDVTATTVHTDAGRVIGTLQYMSPEQVAGDTGAIDRRADVYALGAILYELLAGKAPLELTSRSVPDAARIIGEQEPERLGVVDPTLKGDIETIVTKALAKERDRRYASAGELGADLRRFLSDQPIDARPTSALYQLRKFARRNKAVVAATAGVFAALTLGLIGTGVFAARSELARAAAAESASASRKETYRSYLAAAQAALTSGNGALARQNLEQAPEDLRGWEWRHLEWMADRSTLTITPPLPSIEGVAASADGRSLAVFSAQAGTIHVYDALSGEDRAAVRTDLSSIACVAFTADASRLIVAGQRGADQTLQLRDVGSGDLRWERREPLHFSGSALDATGEFLAATWVTGPVRILRVETGEVVRSLPLPGRVWGRSLVLAPDASCVYAVPEVDGSIICLDAASGDLLWRSDPEGAIHLQRSGDGSRLVNWTGVFDARTGRRLLPITPTPGGDRDLAALSDDNALIASFSPALGVEIKDTLTADTVAALAAPGPLVQMLFLPGSGHLVLATSTQVFVYERPSPSRPLSVAHADTGFGAASAWDAACLLTFGWGDVRRWDPVTLLESWTAIVSRQSCTGLAISPDASHAVVLSRDNRAAVLETASGRIARAFDVPNDLTGRIAWCADATALAGAADGSLVRLSLEDGRVLARLSPGIGGIRTISASRAGTSVMAGGEDGSLLLWDVGSPESPRARATLPGPVVAAAFSSDAALFGAIDASGTLGVWRSRDASEIERVATNVRDPASIVFAPDASRILVGTHDGSVIVVPIPGDRPTLVLRPGARIEGNAAAFYHLIFTPDAHTLLAVTGAGPVELATRLSPRVASERETARRARAFLFRAEREAGDTTPAPWFLRTRAENLARLAADRSLAPDVHAQAHRIVLARTDNPNWLNSEAWRAARDPAAPPETHRQAIALVSAALELFPDDSGFLNTLGMAQYRAGEYRAAIDSFQHSVRARAALGLAPFPEDLLFAALAHHHLGDKERADELLADFRRALPPDFDPASESAGLIREGEAAFGPLR